MDFQWDGKFYSDEFSGFSIFIADDLKYYDRSFTFARHLADEMIKVGLKPSLHHAMKIPGEGRKLLDVKRGVYANSQAVLNLQAFQPRYLRPG